MLTCMYISERDEGERERERQTGRERARARVRERERESERERATSSSFNNKGHAREAAFQAPAIACLFAGAARVHLFARCSPSVA
jgi:hypothetical protein